MQHTRSEMFEVLRHRAGRALGELLGSGVTGSLVNDDAGYLGFFTMGVECLEGGVRKARQRVEEQSRDVLRSAVSRIFGNLHRLDSHVDFEALLEPAPEAIAGPSENWVSDHVDALVTELVPAIEDAPVPEGGDTDSSGEGVDA